MWGCGSNLSFSKAKRMLEITEVVNIMAVAWASQCQNRQYMQETQEGHPPNNIAFQVDGLYLLDDDCRHVDHMFELVE